MSKIEKKIITADELYNICKSLQRQISGLHDCIWQYESYCGLLNDTALKSQVMAEVKEKVNVSMNMQTVTADVLSDFVAQNKNKEND